MVKRQNFTPPGRKTSKSRRGKKKKKSQIFFSVQEPKFRKASQEGKQKGVGSPGISNAMQHRDKKY